MVVHLIAMAMTDHSASGIGFLLHLAVDFSIEETGSRFRDGGCPEQFQ
jgi:hypothetical protein